MGETMRRIEQEKEHATEREPLLLFGPNEHTTTKKTRYQLYALLRQQPMTCDQLVSAAHVTKRSVEMHLRELRARGIISGERMEGDNRIKVWKAHDAIVNDDALAKIEPEAPTPKSMQAAPDDGEARDETESEPSPPTVPFVDALAFEEPDTRNRITATMRARSVTVETIARETKLPFVTAYRHVHMMKKTGMAIRLGDGHTLTTLGSRAVAPQGHARVTQPTALNGSSNAAGIEPRKASIQNSDRADGSKTAAPAGNIGGTDRVTERTAEELEELRRWVIECKGRTSVPEEARTTIDPFRTPRELMEYHLFGPNHAEGKVQTKLAGILTDMETRLKPAEWFLYEHLVAEGKKEVAPRAQLLPLFAVAFPQVPGIAAEEIIALFFTSSRSPKQDQQLRELIAKYFTY